MKKTLVIATFNRHKLEEISAILPGLPLELAALADFSGAVPAEEDGATLEANAAKKAVEAAAFCGRWALADDTGLEVDALGGAPGVNSARYAGDGRSSADNCARLLRELAGVKGPARSARFACVMALASPAGELRTARGVLEGRIAESPRGAGGFGYDPLFEELSSGLTLAGLGADKKNSLSHRALALRAILPELQRLAAD